MVRLLEERFLSKSIGFFGFSPLSINLQNVNKTAHWFIFLYTTCYDYILHSKLRDDFIPAAL